MVGTFWSTLRHPLKCIPDRAPNDPSFVLLCQCTRIISPSEAQQSRGTDLMRLYHDLSAVKPPQQECIERYLMSENSRSISYLSRHTLIHYKANSPLFQSFNSLSNQPQTHRNSAEMKFSAVLALFLAAVAYAAPSNILGGGNDNNVSFTPGVVAGLPANLV